MNIPRISIDPQPLANDYFLAPFKSLLNRRIDLFNNRLQQLKQQHHSLANFALGHNYYGVQSSLCHWTIREWAPNATKILLIGDFTNWQENEEYALKKINDHGDWEISISKLTIAHGEEFRLKVFWEGGCGERIPAYAKRVVQNPHNNSFNAQIWDPGKHYHWKHDQKRKKVVTPIIYEAHIGMAQENEGIGTFNEFKDHVLPRIIEGGYNTIQLMAIMEHPYYGSFGYHVSSFFAQSSKYGTPEEFKELVDTAHKYGIQIIIDLIHSHAVKNEVEGLGNFDGTRYQYFHSDGLGYHEGWDSYLFNYAKPEVLHFLLSNCRYWLEEYHVDGFRFDGITSMLYKHHGMCYSFTNYEDYFNELVDEDAICYLALANHVIHEVYPNAMTIAEDVSGMPGICSTPQEGGCGFDFRLAMGVTDYWYKLFDIRDESWNMFTLWNELTNRRKDERTISYAECHDQAIVGGKSILFRLVDAEIYYNMHRNSPNLIIERGVALHKLTRLATAITSGHGYLNFIGNEFGHPEWIDFPREGNDWSYKHARRLWSVCDNQELRFSELNNFDKVFVNFLTSNDVLSKGNVQVVHIGNNDKIIICERSGYWFIFNFSTQNYYSDYAFEAFPGSYEMVFNSDETRFGGQGQIDPDQVYFSEDVVHNNVRKSIIKVFIPKTTALVLKKRD